jgi:hypothetical protein
MIIRRFMVLPFILFFCAGPASAGPDMMTADAAGCPAEAAQVTDPARNFAHDFPVARRERRDIARTLN